jgi:NADH:ubiquinone oxidoreductase subunit F (NADH-binding)
MQAEHVLAEIDRSGLRGRGGAGFPTGVKWRAIHGHRCLTRYVVCNAAEGEPGTFKDRWLLRRNPYATIEGVLIAARVVGAKAVYIAAKASFGTEIGRVRRALEEMRATIDGLPVTIVEGPDEYLFGEEKALLSVIEGEGPFPRMAEAPPYEVGLFATPESPNPALVNNAETFAHVASIMRSGADSFRRLGTNDTPGTILVTLSGDLARPGVYEVGAGVPLRTLFWELAGGPRPGRVLRAAISGVSSGVILAQQFDTLADFGSLALIGSGLGSAGFMVFDDATSIPRVAQAVARFLYVESCGQCSACKVGLEIASRSIDAVFDTERASPEQLERALIGAQHAPQANRCYLPVEGSILIPSLLRRFRDDFEARLAETQRGEGRDVELPIPKIVDYDAAKHTFTLDALQPLKTSDWTYRVAPDSTAVRPSPPRARPRQPTGPVTVRLAPELASALAALAQAEGRDVDDIINAIVGEWIARKKDGVP